MQPTHKAPAVWDRGTFYTESSAVPQLADTERNGSKSLLFMEGWKQILNCLDFGVLASVYHDCSLVAFYTRIKMAGGATLKVAARLHVSQTPFDNAVGKLNGKLIHKPFSALKEFKAISSFATVLVEKEDNMNWKRKKKHARKYASVEC